MWSFLKFCLWTLVVIVVVAFTFGGSPRNEREISRSEFGDRWPFTVRQGRLKCDHEAVTFTANGIRYAVNGKAKSRKFDPIESVWKHNPSIPGTRISIGPIIQAGLKLCD